MPKKEVRKDELTSNQEHLVAFLVIGLFALMYWLFMHDNDIDLDTTPAIVSTSEAAVVDDSPSINATSAQTNLKKDELEARRDAEATQKENQTKDAEQAKLLSDASLSSESMRELLKETQIQLIAERKLKEEAINNLELEKNKRVDAENQALSLKGEDTQKSADMSSKIEEAEKFAEAQRVKAEQVAEKLQEVEQLAEAERLKGEETSQKLAEAEQLVEAERNKADEIAKKLEMAQKLAEMESIKANENATKLAEFKESQDTINANKVSALAASIDAEKIKAENIAQELFEAKKSAEIERLKAEEAVKSLAQLKENEANNAKQTAQQLEEAKKAEEEERLKAEEAAKQLAQLKESEANKAELLAASIEEERIKAEEIARKLEEAKKAAEDERAKAESTALKLAQLEKLKSEEEARRIEEEKQRKLAEAEREKVEQQLAEAKRLKDQEATLKLSKEKEELEQRIKIAQDALLQREQDRLIFSIADGRTVQIAPNSFESKLKELIINKQTQQPLVFDRVQFASGSASLNRQAIKQIEGVAGVLQAYENNKVLIRGHTDSTGDESKNMTLSLARSLEIKNKLVSLGVNPAMIGVEGLGSKTPIAKNTTREGRRENRRIDLLLLDK